MPGKLLSTRIKTDARTVNELFYEKGWTDGLPIVPPTPDAVLEFLDRNHVEGDRVVGVFPDRNREVSAEKIAINCVMAGCKPEYMPVVMTAIEAMADPAFEFNHIACLSSGFPHFIVNGPVVKQLGMNTGVWLFGSGDRATTTISRAISLTLWNCLSQKPGQVQAGAFGQPGRQSSLVIPENEDTEWEPLSAHFGYEPTDSVLTCVSLYPHFGQAMMTLEDPMYLATAMAERVFSSFLRAPYVIIVPPAMARTFIMAGWSKADLRTYLIENVKYSVAWLKRSGRWGRAARDFPGKRWDPEEYRVKPGEETRYIRLFGSEPDPLDLYVFSKEQVEHSRGDVLIMVGGGDPTYNLAWRAPHNGGQMVTKKIKLPDSGLGSGR